MRAKNGAFWSLLWGRLLVVAILVATTYNVTGFSYYHWVTAGFDGFGSPLGALQILFGVLISVSYIMLLRATWRAKGPIGIFLTLLVLSVLIYFVWTFGVIDLNNPSVSTFIVQFLVTIILAIGSIWSIIWRHWYGQVTVEDADT